MITKFKNKNKYTKHDSTKSGFVLLFVIILSTIILSITFGISNIALKEVLLTVSGADSNNAFFASDAGVECALYLDRSSASPFVTDGIPPDCANIHVNNISSVFPVFDFQIDIGSSCAKIKVTKPTDPTGFTQIISKGYNYCNNTFGHNVVERVLEVNY
ncbi:MAG: hypothetical protein NTZ44_00775 [Candidatus Nomurabacteria bacterium]|nr:hypothetical protein [Candidatus Nomurabacteria bacterium]